MNFKAFTPTNLPHPFNFPLQTTNTTSTTYIMPHTNYLPKALPHSSLFKTPLPSLQELEISIKESYFEGKGGVNAKYELTDEKIQKINKREGKYKRSTNNSHKKFISVAKRLLFLQLSEEQRVEFQTRFDSYKNTKTYYFIILAHAKILLTSEKSLEYKDRFIHMMRNKIDYFRAEIEKAQNTNFKHFRHDQIIDIQFSIDAIHLYFDGHTQQAVRTVYKKEKASIVKKNQCQQAIQRTKIIQQQLRGKAKQKRICQNVILIKEGDAVENGQEMNERCQKVQETNSSKKGIQCKYPLMHLEDSYPFYQCFFSIIFPYDLDNHPYNLNINGAHLPSITQLKRLPPTAASEYKHIFQPSNLNQHTQ